jgi:phospholipid-translocating ATPase
VNEEKFEIISRIDYKPEEIAAKDIQVGDLVYIKCDESIPADLLVLTTSLQNGICYIETVQLDGYLPVRSVSK